MADPVQSLRAARAKMLELLGSPHELKEALEVATRNLSAAEHEASAENREFKKQEQEHATFGVGLFCLVFSSGMIFHCMAWESTRMPLPVFAAFAAVMGAWALTTFMCAKDQWDSIPTRLTLLEHARKKDANKLKERKDAYEKKA